MQSNKVNPQKSPTKAVFKVNRTPKPQAIVNRRESSVEAKEPLRQSTGVIPSTSTLQTYSRLPPTAQLPKPKASIANQKRVSAIPAKPQTDAVPTLKKYTRVPAVNNKGSALVHNYLSKENTLKLQPRNAQTVMKPPVVKMHQVECSNDEEYQNSDSKSINGAAEVNCKVNTLEDSEEKLEILTKKPKLITIVRQSHAVKSVADEKIEGQGVSFIQSLVSVFQNMEIFKSFSGDSEVLELCEGRKDFQFLKKFMRIISEESIITEDLWKGPSGSKLIQNTETPEAATTELLSKLFMGIRIAQFEEVEEEDTGIESIEQLLSVFEEQIGELESELSQESASNILKALSKSKNPNESIIRFLNHLLLDNVSVEIDVDELADTLKTAWCKLMIKSLKSSMKTGSMNSDTLMSLFMSTKTDESTIPSSYTNFRIMPNLTVGYLNLSAEIIAAVATRPYMIVFPDNRRISLPKTRQLFKLDPAYDCKTSRLFSDYPVPNMMNLVKMAEKIVPDASVDFDWMMMSYNTVNKTILWQAGNQIKFNYEYHQLSKATIFALDQDQQHNNMKTFKILMFRNKKQTKNIRINIINTDLFIGDMKASTVNDLVQYCKTRFSLDKVGYDDINFINLSSGKEFIPVKGEDKITDILKKIGSDPEAENKTQQLTYACYFTNPDVSDAFENYQNSAEEHTQVNKRAFQKGLRSNLTTFLDFHSQKTISPSSILAVSQSRIPLVDGNAISYYLPSCLIVDISRLPASTIDPLERLSLRYYSRYLQASGLAVGNSYEVVGLILCRSAAGSVAYEAAVGGCDGDGCGDHVRVSHVVFNRVVEYVR